MPSAQIEKSSTARKTIPSKQPRGARKTAGNLTEAARVTRPKPAPFDETATPRTTKQEQVLTLLSRPNGVTIEEVMKATDWQMHSVRGFLAGTVKKKLGFNLTSSKAQGEMRRYRILSRHGR